MNIIGVGVETLVRYARKIDVWSIYKVPIYAIRQIPVKTILNKFSVSSGYHVSDTFFEHDVSMTTFIFYYWSCTTDNNHTSGFTGRFINCIIVDV